MEVTSSLRSISCFQHGGLTRGFTTFSHAWGNNNHKIYFFSSIMSAAVLETNKPTVNCWEGRNCRVTFRGEILHVTQTCQRQQHKDKLMFFSPSLVA